ncbi:hypothetical protein [Microbulbifer sp. VAAF005]|nr:hypothetical protein [Microbulbifer sp. VAAF005]WHI44514.1 hypothetical protein P0078_12170 [Microbulbifer sp. VAAF005]
MNDKTRIVRPSGTPPGSSESTSGLTEDGDITVIVQQDKTGANDHPH